MKIRILALITAILMCLSACAFAEGTVPASTNPLHAEIEAATGTVVVQALLVPEMDMTLDDWMSTPENRAMFILLIDLSMYNEPERLTFKDIDNAYATPAMFMATPAGMEGQAVNAIYYFEDAGVFYNVVYWPEMDGAVIVDTQEFDGDVYDYLQYMIDGGSLIDYYEITEEDYMSAFALLAQILEVE